MKRKIKLFSAFSLLLAPSSLIVGCANNDTKGRIYAARVANIDSLIALGYQPSFVNKTFDGKVLPSYIEGFAKKNFTKKLHNRPAWDQTIDNENFISKKIDAAFIANFQSRLYKAIKSAGLSKERIGTTTMGESYIPNIDYRNNKDKGASIKDRIQAWNKEQDLVKVYGRARPSSIGMSNKHLLHLSDNSSALKNESNNIINSKEQFTYTADVRESLKITAENVDRIAKNKNQESLKRANKINLALNNRISDLRNKVNAGQKTILALKPNRNAKNANEIINNHFSWDPSTYAFLYSEKIGLGYEFPKVSNTDYIQWLENDSDGLKMTSHAAVKAAFNQQLDSIIFLRPPNYPISNDSIKVELKSLTRNNNVNDVHIMKQDTMWEGMWGPIGYFSAMDSFAQEFKVENFSTGVKNWGWKTILPQDLKINI